VTVQEVERGVRSCEIGRPFVLTETALSSPLASSPLSAPGFAHGSRTAAPDANCRCVIYTYVNVAQTQDNGQFDFDGQRRHGMLAFVAIGVGKASP
jgi:hypothetical protein